MAHNSFQLAASGGHIFLVSNQTFLSSPDATSIIDKLGYGTAIHPENTVFTPAPSASTSMERKAFYFSGLSAMSSTHAPYGNSYDSDNNAADFILRSSPEPQNSTSPTERCCTTVEGALTLQGRADSSGIQVLMWPGSGLRIDTDSDGHFSIPDVPAFASADTSAYTVEATFPGYLSAKTSLDLTSAPLPTAVTYSALRLLAGDLNGDNRVNIFDLAIIGGQYGSAGSLTGDVNGDGKVNIQDLSLASGNFGQDSSQYTWSP